LREQVQAGGRLLEQTYGTYTIQFDPSRRIPRISLNGRLGEAIDFDQGNWQTVLFLGYGDDRLLTADNRLLRSDRSFFFKVSYAVQR
jgi:hypothetical protein